MKNNALFVGRLFALFIFITPLSWGHNLIVGESVPKVIVNDYGELILKKGDIEYQSWDSEKMLGKVRVIQAIAGRTSAKKMNQPLMQAITASKLPEKLYQTTSIINQDDAVWGTSNFVRSSAKDSKRDFPWSSIVLDKEGTVAKAWQLDKKSSAIIVQDYEGKILFVKEGPLGEQEVEQVISLIKSQL